MKMPIRTLTFFLLLCLLMPLSAQDEPETPHPLLEMLQAVPLTNTIVSYADYSAIAATGITPAPVDDMAQFENDEDASRRWVMRAQRIITGPQILTSLIQAVDMPNVVGFDFFDIERGLTFGDPPLQGMILGGDFDADAIGAAHEAREYTLTDIEGVPAWCGPAGCDRGTQPDPANRNPSNIFDPQLGRKPPVLLLEGARHKEARPLVASAFDLSIARSIASAATNEAASLGDDPNISAAAAALTGLEAEYGDLLQVMFIPFVLTERIDYSMAETPEELETLTRDLMQPFMEEWLSYGDLPPYTLAALADFQNDEQQSAVIALVYANVEDAEAAAAEVSARMSLFSDGLIRNRGGEPLLDMIEGSAMAEPIIVELEERAVALITVTYPLVDDTNLDADPLERSTSGFMYRAWIQSVYTRGFYPIWQITLPDFE